MIIGIISYLPNDENLRLKRLQAHHKQIELLNKLNCSIYILAQNYKKEELLNNNNIHYILFDNGIGPSNTRNELLKRFYKSSEDWMLLCDDDRYFYDYYNIYDFFSELNITSSKFLQLDYIRSHMASKLPFKKQIYEQPLNLTHYVFEDTQTIGDTGIAIIKNFKKYYNKELYYDNLKAENGEGYEDKDFCCQLKLNHIKTHILTTFISASYNYTENSTLFTSMDNRLELHENNNIAVIERYKFTDLFINNHLNPIYKDEPITIERLNKITIPDNLKPEYKTLKNILF